MQSQSQSFRFFINSSDPTTNPKFPFFVFLAADIALFRIFVV